MISSPSLLVKLTARLLEPREREVVLGDLTEVHASSGQVVFQVLDLGIRRHAALWLNWRPWLAGPGLALPASFLLMGVSLSVSQACLQLVNSDTGSVTWLLTQMCLLLIWSWTSGFVIGSLSRRTLWASIAMCCWPCCLCVSTFHLELLSPVCLLWFLIPAGLGVRQGLSGKRIRLSVALTITTVLMLAMLLRWHGGAQRWWSPPWWLVDFVMSWPTLFLVARASSRAESE
jgi:hypothetical protein